MEIPSRIILSRTDAIGDAVVTMTTAGWVKLHAPETHVTVVARRYAMPVWRHCAHADRLVALEELQAAGEGGAVDALRSLGAGAIVHVFPQRDVARWAKNAGIPRRIGTGRRWWNWLACNERVHYSRRRSSLHEAQLNIGLLKPFGLPVPASVRDLVPHLGFRVPPPSEKVRAILRPGKRRLVVHPLLGSGVGWGLSNFAALLRAVDGGRWQVLVTGTLSEAERYRPALPLDLAHVTDTGGRLDLDEVIQLIGASDAFVSASTGPLHLAAAAGIRAVGLFSMRRPIFPTRWAPIGADAQVLVHDPACAACGAGRSCDCITRIPPERVLALLGTPG